MGTKLSSINRDSTYGSNEVEKVMFSYEPWSIGLKVAIVILLSVRVWQEMQ